MAIFALPSNTPQSRTISSRNLRQNPSRFHEGDQFSGLDMNMPVVAIPLESGELAQPNDLHDRRVDAGLESKGFVQGPL